MIQELLGGLAGDRNISTPFSSTCCSIAPFLTTNTSVSATNILNPQNSLKNDGITATTTISTTNNNLENSSSQNLRCPRCDSTNTKFCYYNNYNLTQPRHFCKACRRYWTKGGTLRNVPIGGGCRKNKNSFQSNSSSFSNNNSNAIVRANKTNLSNSCDMLVNENSLFLGNGLLDHPLQLPGPSPLLWSSLPQAQNSHILSLLGGSTTFQNPNPNPGQNPTSSVFTSLGLDSQLGFGSNYVDNNDGSTSNILDIYQRSKSSTLSSNHGYSSNGNDNPGSVILGYVVGSTSSLNSTMLDATPLSVGIDHFGANYGFMNTSPRISSWSDFHAQVPINGAYP